MLRSASLSGFSALHRRRTAGTGQPQPADRDLGALLHPGVVRVEVAGEAAVLQLNPVGVLEVDRLGPVVVDHVRHLDAAGDERVAHLVEPRLGASLEREVIERVPPPEPVVDPGVVLRRYARHAPRFHEGNELIAPGVEEDVADLPAFLDPEGVAAHRLELQDVLVEVTRPVEIQCREADVREPLVRHRGPSFQPSTRLEVASSNPTISVRPFRNVGARRLPVGPSSRPSSFTRTGGQSDSGSSRASSAASSTAAAWLPPGCPVRFASRAYCPRVAAWWVPPVSLLPIYRGRQ